MAMPRMIALAEVVWSAKNRRSWQSFNNRMQNHYDYLDREKVQYRIPQLPELRKKTIFSKSETVSFAKLHKDLKITYTLDGTTPTKDSTELTKSVTIDHNCIFTAQGFYPNGRKTNIVKSSFEKAHYKSSKSNPKHLIAGLKATIHRGSFKSVKAMNEKNCCAKKIAKKISLRSLGLSGDGFGLILTGYILIPKDSVYTFALKSDDGSSLSIDGELIVDHDGPHGASLKDGQIALKKGLFPIKISYFELAGDETLELFLKDESQDTLQPLNPKMLLHQGTNSELK
jgi:hexosaminidase